MKVIFDFDAFDSAAKEGFRERVGEPGELDAAIGLISVSFSNLEDELSKRITQLLRIPDDLGSIVTCELSYKNKVNLFLSLVRYLKKTLPSVAFPNYPEEFLNGLSKALFRCEELRNNVVHSILIVDRQTSTRFVREKVTAKAKHGLIRRREGMEVYNLMNIYDFTVSMIERLRDFFLDYDMPDKSAKDG